jgi:HEAT repeat protein
MPAKKNSKKSSANRYTSAPSKANAPKAKEVPAINVEAKLPPASAAAEIRIESPATSAAARLIAGLRDSDADIARDAATSLGALGDSAAVEPLIQILNNVDGYYHAVVRAAAAVSLGRLGDRRAVEPLLNTIEDSLAEPSAEAIRALAAIGDSRAVSPLIDVVRNPSGFFLPIARRAAVVALSRFKSDEKAKAELLTVSTNPWEDPVIRQAAVDVVGSSAKNRSEI